MTKRQAYSREFKIEAVRLLNEGTKKSADLARELGIKRNQLYKWKNFRMGVHFILPCSRALFYLRPSMGSCSLVTFPTSLWVTPE